MVCAASGPLRSLEWLIACAIGFGLHPRDDPASTQPSPAASVKVAALAPLAEPVQVQPLAPILIRDDVSRLSVFTEDAELRGQTPLCLAFERDGAVWIAYTGGLKRYDGYRWRLYGVPDGLPSNFARCVFVDRAGKVWVGTDQGVSIFDPARLKFSRFDPPGGLAAASVRRIVQAPDGAMWFCGDHFPDMRFPGGLTRWREGDASVSRYGIEDGLPSDRVHNLFFDSTGQAFALTARGAACLQGNRWVRFLEQAGFAEADQGLFGIAESPRHGLAIAGQSAIYQRRTPGSPWIRRPVADGSPMPMVLVCASDGEFYAPMKQGEAALLCRWDDRNSSFTRVAELEREGQHNFYEDVREAPDGSIWIAGPTYLARWNRANPSEWSFYRNMPPPLFQDRFETIWFGWPDGNYAVRFRPGSARWEEVIHCRGRMTRDLDGQAWQTDGAVARCWGETKWTDNDLRSLGIARITGFGLDQSGSVWITGEDAVDTSIRVVIGEAMGATRDADPPSARRWMKTVWDLPKGWRRLNHGPVWTDPGRGVWTVVADRGNRYWIVSLNREGARRTRLPPKLQPRADEWLDNSADAAIDGCMTSRGDLWLFGYLGSCILDTRTMSCREVDTIAIGSRKIMEGAERGRSVWFATASWLGGKNGLMELSRGRWTFHDTVAPPRFLGQASVDGSLFLFIDKRVQAISADSRLLGGFTVPGHSHDVAGVLKDRSNTIWVGSWSNELGRFRPDGIPPDTILEASDRDVTQGRRLSVEAIGVEKFRSRLEGREIRFSWRIDDGEWSDYGRTLELPSTENLAIGRHVLSVRAMDESNDVDPTPERLDFYIYPIPLQQRPWFGPGLAGFAGLVSILGFWGLHSSVVAKRARDAAEKANRVKSAILNNVNHEIRTPMNAIQTMARLLQGTSLTEEQADFVDSIRKGGQALMAIIDGLFDFAEIDRGWTNIELKPFMAEPWAQAVAAAYEAAATEKRLKFGLRIASDVPPWVVSDPERLAMATRQILDNAVKFTDRGDIELELSWRTVSGAGAWLVISVFDSGAGLSPEDHRRLFQPFSSLDPAWSRRYGGIGLGLAICSRLAERLGGRVWSEPRSGRGSVFRLEVPATVPASSPAPSEAVGDVVRPRLDRSRPDNGDGKRNVDGNGNGRGCHSVLKPDSDLGSPRFAASPGRGFDSDLATRRPLSILIVEDLALNRKVIGLMLKRFGYCPEFAAHGGEAVAALERKTFDLVLMDLQMPEMDGLEATRVIRQRWGTNSPRIVALTANNLPCDRNAAFEAGMDGFLAKPVSPEDLAQCLLRTDQPLPA